LRSDEVFVGAGVREHRLIVLSPTVSRCSPLAAWIGLILLVMIFVRLGAIRRELTAIREAKEQQFMQCTTWCGTWSFAAP
jgi:hypothetical protein